MPKIGAGETEDSFVSRCVSVRQKENPGESQKQSVAICYSMYRDKKGGKKPKGK